mmetsp:Transcript_93833/g.264986  ORF Transcript_93833/g.264986 Transcript_93833/m.264986 type:complete len:281 (-) Transcript_93833:568-1410(-)
MPWCPKRAMAQNSESMTSALCTGASAMNKGYAPRTASAATSTEKAGAGNRFPGEGLPGGAGATATADFEAAPPNSRRNAATLAKLRRANTIGNTEAKAAHGNRAFGLAPDSFRGKPPPASPLGRHVRNSHASRKRRSPPQEGAAKKASNRPHGSCGTWSMRGPKGLSRDAGNMRPRTCRCDKVPLPTSKCRCQDKLSPRASNQSTLTEVLTPSPSPADRTPRAKDSTHRPHSAPQLSSGTTATGPNVGCSRAALWRAATTEAGSVAKAPNIASSSQGTGP